MGELVGSTISAGYWSEGEEEKGTKDPGSNGGEPRAERSSLEGEEILLTNQLPPWATGVLPLWEF